jgi:hypothetical protein
VKTIEDLKRLSEQFRDLIFGDETITSEEEMVKSEKDMKKLLTVTKSKFYMLRVNFPKAFETIVDREINQGEEYDPLAEKKPQASDNLNKDKASSMTSSVDLDEDET